MSKDCISFRCCFYDQANETCTLTNKDAGLTDEEFYEMCPAVESDPWDDD